MSKTDDEVEDLPLDEGENEQEEEEPEVWNSEDLISGHIRSTDSTVPENVLEFDFSYSYDCKRYYNLIAPDPDTLLFVSGNLIHFFSVPEQRVVRLRRCAFGYGIGHMTKNPNLEYSHIAVAENGINPPIIIYEWPSLEVVCLLKGGSTKRFSHLGYSPKGDLLVSQAGEPDYLITIFKWADRKILLRTKSYVNTVYNVVFSPEVPGQLSTCGLSHIKFWKMASTFTGLKLQGDVGRFGKTEYSDIVGIMPMPDEKILSGCAWGNILVWDEGLIKLEVCRRLRKKCHNGPIMQILYNSEKGEVWTAALDGRIRVWLYDAIDQADPPDDDRVFELEPSYDFYIQDVEFVSYCRVDDKDPENTFHYAQDGNGGLWIIDLNTVKPPEPSVQLFKCHAGAVVDVAACPWGSYFGSLGEDGRLFFYNYVERKMIFYYEFPAKGRCMIWLPLSVEPSGDQIIIGFDDGCLRSVIFSVSATQSPSLAYFQLTKPHHKPITAMALNRMGKILVTGGEDMTVFVYKVFPQRNDFTTLMPIGYVPVPDVVTCLLWYIVPDTAVAVGCLHGQFVLIDVPREPVSYTKITYNLIAEVVEHKFTTYKSQIRREIIIKEIEKKKEEKVEKKRKEMERIKKDNPGLDIDEEVFLADSESSEELEPLYFPEIPNRIIWMQTTPEGTIWLNMGGYDAGYIYEYKMGQPDDLPKRCTMVNDADDIEISSYVYNKSRKYLILAMDDGSIRVNRVNKENFRDLSDYWKLNMHDNFNGYIPSLALSYDERYFFSCGHDGNVFAYKWFPGNNDYEKDLSIRMKFTKKLAPIEDINQYETLSLEQAIVKKELDRIQNLADLHKSVYIKKIENLKKRFKTLLEQNQELLSTQVIPHDELELDPRVSEDLEQQLDADLALVERKLEFAVKKSETRMKKILGRYTENLDCFPITVHGVNSESKVKVLRAYKLDPKFYPMQEEVDRRIVDEDIKAKNQERIKPLERPVPQVMRKPAARRPAGKLELFLMGIDVDTVNNKLGPKLKRMLQRYRERKVKWEVRNLQWENFKMLKPVPGTNLPEDVAALVEAKATIGDYKLKSDPSYKAPKLKETTVKKYKQFLNVRQRQYFYRHNFNEKVYELRKKKEDLKKYLEEMHVVLKDIQHELPETAHKHVPPLPKEYPEDYIDKNLDVVVEVTREIPEEIEKDEPIIRLVKSPDENRLQKEILPHGHIFEIIPKDIQSALPCEAIINVCNSSFETLLKNTYVEAGTPWEQEAKVRRLCRKLYEQDRGLEDINKAIEDFDKMVEDLYVESHNVEFEVGYLDMFLSVLHQELIVLKEFETVEMKLSDEVNETFKDVIDMEQLIQEKMHDIDKRRETIEHFLIEERDIQDNFAQATANNKFYDFLRRIFKKKYKPPKEHTDDSDSDSSSSSSSSSESSEGGESIDSRDFGIIKLDENVCPKGCDLTLYNMTFDLRSQRYALEIQVREEQKQIELLMKEIEMNNKKLEKIEQQYKNKQEELDSYQRKKQIRLNEIMVAGLFKLHQLQHFISENKTAKIQDCLVFSKKKLTALYNRVNELQAETLEQKAKHKINKVHMARMQTDLKIMAKKKLNVKRGIISTMKERFGRVVDIDELEEAKIIGSMHLNIDNALNFKEMEETLLKDIVKNIQLNSLDIRSMYANKITFYKNKERSKQCELLRAIKDNTARMDLLAALKREKEELMKIIKQQPQKREYMQKLIKSTHDHKKEVYQLAEVVRGQRKQLQELKEEIRKLSTKGLCLKPEDKFEFPKVMVATEPELDEWLDFDEYMELFEDYYAQKFEQERAFIRYQWEQEKQQRLAELLTKEAEQEVEKIMNEMFEALGREITKKENERFIRHVISTILDRCSIQDLVRDIIKNLPLKPSDEEQAIIETTAEKLLSLQAPGVTKHDIEECVYTLIDETIETALSTTEDAHEAVTKIVEDLVEQLPIQMLQNQKSIEFIGERIDMNFSDIQFNKQEIIDKIDEEPKALREDMMTILDKVLDNVVTRRSIEDIPSRDITHFTSDFVEDPAINVIDHISHRVLKEAEEHIPSESIQISDYVSGPAIDVIGQGSHRVLKEAEELPSESVQILDTVPERDTDAGARD